jgi:hypothetical protein
MATAKKTAAKKAAPKRATAAAEDIAVKPTLEEITGENKAMINGWIENDIYSPKTRPIAVASGIKAIIEQCEAGNVDTDLEGKDLEKEVTRLMNEED